MYTFLYKFFHYLCISFLFVCFSFYFEPYFLFLHFTFLLFLKCLAKIDTRDTAVNLFCNGNVPVKPRLLFSNLKDFAFLDVAKSFLLIILHLSVKTADNRISVNKLMYLHFVFPARPFHSSYNVQCKDM